MAGIYILERMAIESPDARGTVEMLAAFVRGRAPVEECVVPLHAFSQAPPDVTTAVTVLARMPRNRDLRLDLSKTCLAVVSVQNADLPNTDFSAADLTLANFAQGNLSGSSFSDAVMTFAGFDRANISRSFFGSANGIHFSVPTDRVTRR